MVDHLFSEENINYLILKVKEAEMLSMTFTDYIFFFLQKEKMCLKMSCPA